MPFMTVVLRQNQVLYCTNFFWPIRKLRAPGRVARENGAVNLRALVFFFKESNVPSRLALFVAHVDGQGHKNLLRKQPGIVAGVARRLGWVSADRYCRSRRGHALCKEAHVNKINLLANCVTETPQQQHVQQ